MLCNITQLNYNLKQMTQSFNGQCVYVVPLAQPHEFPEVAVSISWTLTEWSYPLTVMTGKDTNEG